MQKDEVRARRTFNRRMQSAVTEAIAEIDKALVAIGHEPSDAILKARLKEVIDGFFGDVHERFNLHRDPWRIVDQTAEAVLQLVASVPKDRPRFSEPQTEIVRLGIRSGLYGAVAGLANAMIGVNRLYHARVQRKLRKSKKGGAK